ncbi:Vacuolar protein sorting-associated protein 8-like protein [Auxenochlorella protothecoides]|uniref:Vacuolar protein sorting-associated protein 8-like protein n=1 Tax=Auxenochlorella protothecoides TaxID=3075 RepID=A0A087SSH4_AUXPR|nr:Vacuolar protein sorting-associated protein 8-like protein [Auxenochlorella protothecoides]KFM28678.1 Vacuolar protein sorting-associated protein 8-like protein [Auxenochlorella protothecoides]
MQVPASLGRQALDGAAPSIGDHSEESTASDPLVECAMLLEQLAPLDGSWPEEGWQDGRGTVTGSHAAIRAFQSVPFDPLFRGGQTGQPTCIARYLGMVAVGTSIGTAAVFVPGPPSPAVSGAATSGPRPTAATADPSGLRLVADPSIPRGDAVACLALGSHAGGPLLVTGHAVHGARVVCAALADGGGVTWALTADAHGRLLAHDVNRHLSATSQALTSFARQLTGSASVPSHVLDLASAATPPGSKPGDRPPRDAHSVLAIDVLASHRSLGGRGSETPGVAPSLSHFTPIGHWVLAGTPHAVLVCQLTPEGRLRVHHAFRDPGLEGQDEWSGPPGPPIATWGISEDWSEPGGRRTVHIAIAWSGGRVALYRTSIMDSLPPPVAEDGGSRRGDASHAASPGPGGTSASNPATPPPRRDHRAEAPLLAEPEALGVLRLPSAPSALQLLQSGSLTALAPWGPAGTSTAVWMFADPWRGGDTHGPGHGALQTPHMTGVDSMRLPDWLAGGPPPDEANGGSGGASAPGPPPPAGNAVAFAGDQVVLLGSRHVSVLQRCTWDQRCAALAAAGRHGAVLCACLKAEARVLMVPRGGRPGLESAWPADRPPSGRAAVHGAAERALLALLADQLAGPQGARGTGGSGDHHGCTASSHAFLSPVVLADVAVRTCLLLGRPDLLSGAVANAFLSAPGAQDQGAAGRGELGEASLATPRHAFLEALVPHVSAGRLTSLGPEVMQELVGSYAAAGRPEVVEACVLRLDPTTLDLSQVVPLCMRHDLHAALIAIFGGVLRDWTTPLCLLLVEAVSAGAAQEGKGDAEAGAASHGPRGAGCQADGLRPYTAREMQLAARLWLLLEACLLGLGYPPHRAGSLDPGVAPVAKSQALAFLLLTPWPAIADCWRAWSGGQRESGGQNSAPPAVQQSRHPALTFLMDLDPLSTLAVLSSGLEGWEAMLGDVVDLAGQSCPRMDQDTLDSTVTQHAVDVLAAEVLATWPADVPQARASLDFIGAHLAAGRARACGGVVLRVLQRLAALPHGEAAFTAVTAVNAAAMTPRERGEALSLARRHSFPRAEASLHHAGGDYAAALASCLSIESWGAETSEGSLAPRAPAAAYAESVLDGSTQIDAGTRSAFLEHAVSRAAAFVAQDADSAAAFFLRWIAPDRQRQILEGLASQAQLHYGYLGALVGLGDGGGRLKLQPQGYQVLSALLRERGVVDRYVDLLCQHEPQKVLAFLQSHDGYSVTACQQACMRHEGCQTAAGYLLERSGDSSAALEVYVQALAASTLALARRIARSSDADLAEFMMSQHSLGEDIDLRRGSFSAGTASRGAWPDASSPHAPLPGSSMPELQASQRALEAALTLCTRVSQEAEHDGLGDGASSAPDTKPQSLWFRLLEFCLLQALDREGALQGWAVLHALLLGFAQQVVAGAAGRVSPRSIAERIIAAAGRVGSDAQCAARRPGPMAGGFRATLLSLLSTCSLEASLLRCARTAAGSDGAGLLTLAAGACSKPTLMLSAGGSTLDMTMGGAGHVTQQPEAANSQHEPLAS